MTEIEGEAKKYSIYIFNMYHGQWKKSRPKHLMESSHFNLQIMRNSINFTFSRDSRWYNIIIYNIPCNLAGSGARRRWDPDGSWRGGGGGVLGVRGRVPVPAAYARLLRGLWSVWWAASRRHQQHLQYRYGGAAPPSSFNMCIFPLHLL